MFYRKALHKNPAIVTGKHVLEYLFNAVADQCFSVNIAKFLSTNFEENLWTAASEAPTPTL